MKKEILLGLLLAILVIYVVFVGIPLIRVESEEKIIEMKAEEQDYSKKLEILLPAVEENGEGIMARLGVEAVDGEGRTLLEINEISFWEDTQESIRIAKSVAEELTTRDISTYDIIYSVNANASKIEGPSAGPAMAIATVIAMKDKQINKSVVISGYLREDGSIAKVSGVLAKAEAAKENNVKLFLVPLGQKIQTKIETKKDCETVGLDTYCETETIETQVDLQEEVGIDVVEVGSVEEALRYFVVG